MIVVKVELWPHGDAELAEALAVVAIANVGQEPRGELEPTGQRWVDPDPDEFAYDVQLQEYQTGTTKAPPKVRRAHITHWRRRGWKTLVRRALNEVL